MLIKAYLILNISDYTVDYTVCGTVDMLSLHTHNERGDEERKCVNIGKDLPQRTK